MSQIASDLARAVAHLGQPVRLAAKPWRQLGYMVAVRVAEPYEALVRWTDTEATFEPLNDLVDEDGAALTGSERPPLNRADARMQEHPRALGLRRFDFDFGDPPRPPVAFDALVLVADWAARRRASRVRAEHQRDRDGE